MPIGSLGTPFQRWIQASFLLVLICVLPFIEIMGAWFFWGRFLFFTATLVLGLWVLPVAAVNWRISWPPLALGAWILFQVLRTPEWDRSFGLLMAWGCALILGLITHELCRHVPSFPWAFCLLLWGLATAIAVVNPIWTVPVEVMEESLQGEMYDEGYKQAILHAASQNRFHFPFGNPIDLGVFLSLSLLATPVLLERAWRSRSARVFIMGSLVSACEQVYILLGTRSRTSLVGLFAGICVWLAWKGKGGMRMVWAVILAIFLGATVLCLSPTGREMLSRTETVHARLVFWEAGLRMARENPLLGFGIGGYGSNYPRFRDLTTHQTVYAHNLLIETMADMGAVGLVLLLIVLFQFFRRVWRMNLPLRGSTLLDVWCSSALVCFFISTLLGFHQDMLYLAGFVGVIAGMGGEPDSCGIAGTRILSRSNGTFRNLLLAGGKATFFNRLLTMQCHRPRWMMKKEPPTPGTGGGGIKDCMNDELPLPYPRRTTELQPGDTYNSHLRPCLVVIVLLAVGIPCAFREAGQALYEKAADSFERQRDVPRTGRLLERAVLVWPPLAEAHSYLGEMLLDIGNLPDAERSMRTALYWNPTAGFLHDSLAEVLARMDRREEALQEIDQAIALHPVKYNYHLHRSRLLYDLGRTTEAARAKAQGEYLEQFEPRYEEARKAQATQARG